jgi:hypothetical protein
MVHTCNPSTQKAEAGGSLVWGQPGLQSELEASLGCMVRPCLKNNKTKQNKTNTIK